MCKSAPELVDAQNMSLANNKYKTSNCSTMQLATCVKGQFQVSSSKISQCYCTLWLNIKISEEKVVNSENVKELRLNKEANYDSTNKKIFSTNHQSKHHIVRRNFQRAYLKTGCKSYQKHKNWNWKTEEQVA